MKPGLRTETGSFESQFLLDVQQILGFLGRREKKKKGQHFHSCNQFSLPRMIF